MESIGESARRLGEGVRSRFSDEHRRGVFEERVARPLGPSGASWLNDFITSMKRTTQEDDMGSNQGNQGGNQGNKQGLRAGAEAMKQAGQPTRQGQGEMPRSRPVQRQDAQRQDAGGPEKRVPQAAGATAPSQSRPTPEKRAVETEFENVEENRSGEGDGEVEYVREKETVRVHGLEEQDSEAGGRGMTRYEALAIAHQVGEQNSGIPFAELATFLHNFMTSVPVSELTVENISSQLEAHRLFVRDASEVDFGYRALSQSDVNVALPQSAEEEGDDAREQG